MCVGGRVEGWGEGVNSMCHSLRSNVDLQGVPVAAGLTPGLAQWVMLQIDPALLWLWPSLGTSICCGFGPKKKQRKKKGLPLGGQGLH